ncbi:MAG: biotin--[acetyl-CoA-carboxylase] ligase [Bacteroides sp.]|nr:biotin--[acetyl-CoA-carboxylase] ligase [Bacteroides sp.]
MISLIKLDSVDSTSSYLARHLPDAPHGTVVAAREQSAGRGQRGNSWEAAPGLNVTMSLMLRPASLAAVRQFVLSQAVALAVADTVDTLLPPGMTASVKWPNDIYVGDRKIAGILIENVLDGARVSRSIVGLGLNVNQARFLSPAPNPVSIFQLTGLTHDVESLTMSLAENIVTLTERALSSPDEAEALAERYFSRLWRSDGWWPFHDNLRDTDMIARIDSVDPMGFITLTDRESLAPHVYAFKEISFLL